MKNKNYVIDIGELQEIVPFFRSRFGTFLGKRLIKWLCVEKINRLYRNSMHLRGHAFTSSILRDPLINISYKIHNAEVLNTLPEGAFITVSNHPVGSLDGVVLIDIFASRRPDFKVMVNGILSNIEAMEDNFISVTPDSKRQGANLANVNGIRASLTSLREGHPMGFFPAGGISCYDKQLKKVRDIPWTRNVIRLIRKANLPVYPVYFDFYNSRFFYWLGTISWKIRTFRIPAEVFNKRGQTLHIYIGEPIATETIKQLTSDDELAQFLYNETYKARSNNV